MSETAIKVESISKKYYIGENKKYPTLRDKLVELPSRIFKGPKKDKEFWALKDISFEIKKGEVVGIIGRNGAGKSTLLKVLARITEPTHGKIIMHGRVASMLEVGTGFNPELTGRENIFLNGAIIGMTKNEIRSKFDDIVAFSGINKFLDTPVKHYSSGMYVRLAFAVAAYLDADILLVDEVLAVGDIEFQKKCIGKMTDLAESGRTVIFVSHNVESVRRLCSRIIFLESSKVKFDGPTNKAMDLYLHTGITSKRQVILPEKKGLEINVRKIWLTNEKGEFASTFQINESPNIHLELAIATQELKRAEISIQITNSRGVNLIFSSLSEMNRNHFYQFKKGIYQTSMLIDANLLLPDTYSITVTTHYRGERRIELIENAFLFEIVESNSSLSAYGAASKSLACLISGTRWMISAENS